MLAVNNLSEDFWLNVKEYSENPNYSFFGYAFGGGSAKDIQNPDKWILIKDTDLLSIRPLKILTPLLILSTNGMSLTV